MFKPGFGVHLKVSNLERTVAFYTEKLGFKVLFHDANQGQAMVATHTRDCFMGFAQNPAIAASSTCITFEVENIEAAVQILEQKGIEFQGGIIEVPGVVKLAEFTDPDGYKLMLSQVMGG